MATKGMDPLMKKLYIGLAAVVLFLTCTIWGCMSCGKGGKEMGWYKCRKEGCAGRVEVQMQGKKPKSGKIPTCVDTHGQMKLEE